MKTKRIAILAVAALALAMTGTSFATTIPGGSLIVNNGSQSAWMAPTGYDFAANPYSLNLSYAGSPVTLSSGDVDLSGVPMPGSGEYSSYYQGFTTKDWGTRQIRVVMNTDWLGSWRGISAQPWDRIRIETVNLWGTVHGGPELYFSTQGGQTDDGGGWIYPSDREYQFKTVFDPSAQTVNLSVYGKGRTNTDVKEWHDVGSMVLTDEACWGDDKRYTGLDFPHTHLYSWLWSSKACTVSYGSMDIAPIHDVPEPGTLMLLLTAGLGALAFAWRRRRS